jgi:alginate O-acetyltransferase complex protein AlgJ
MSESGARERLESRARGLFHDLSRLHHDLSRLYYDGVLNFHARISTGELKAATPYRRRNVLHHDVIWGKSGFLFHRDHDALEQLRGPVVFRGRQIEVWNEALKLRNDWCLANSCKMRLLIIPEKHVVYDQFLPDWIRISDSRPSIQLMNSVDSAIKSKFVYPIDELREASRRGQTFLKTDTHWSSFGAFTAYQALIRSLQSEIRLEMPDEADIYWGEAPFVGDLGVRLEPEVGEQITNAIPPTKYALTYLNRIFDRGAVHVYASERADLPRCVIFRDSFSNALIPFLMQTFSRVVAVSSLSCLYDLLEHEKPDVVIFAVIERFLATFGKGEFIELPNDGGEVSFHALTGVSFDEIQNYADSNT